jgi:hypothetical protein
MHTIYNATDLATDMSSYFSCVNLASPTEFKRCRGYNLCSHRGEFLFFVPREPESKRLPASNWDRTGQRVFKQGLLFQTDSRGHHHLNPRYVTDHIAGYIRTKGIPLVKWHNRPAYFLNKHACTNGGHCIAENLLLVVSNMVSWGFASQNDIFDNELIILEYESKSCGCTTNRDACGGEGMAPHFLALCRYFVDMYLGLTSRNKISYLDDLESHRGQVMDCWSTVYGGAGAAGPYHSETTGVQQQMEQFGLTYNLLRDLAYHRHHVTLPTHSERRLNHLTNITTLNVLINKKAGRRIIGNMDFVSDWISSYVMTVRGFGRMYPKLEKVTYNVTVIQWENIKGLKSQLELLRNTDILISPFGSGSFNALFLPDATSLITTPSCLVQNGEPLCDNFEGDVLHVHQVHYDTFYYSPNLKSDIYLPPNEKLLYSLNMEKTHLIGLLQEASNSILFRF